MSPEGQLFLSRRGSSHGLFPLPPSVIVLKIDSLEASIDYRAHALKKLSLTEEPFRTTIPKRSWRAARRRPAGKGHR